MRRQLSAALHTHGVALPDVRWVVNCHLHFDHCGGNPALPDRPIYVQAAELAQARTDAAYTLAHLVDFAGAQYEPLSGAAEVLSGIWVLPTPGHTAGHQSLAVRCTDGTVVLAGQAHDTATAFGADQLAWRARRDGLAEPLPVPPAWLERLLAFDPARVLFAHDLAVWVPDRT